MNRRQDSPDIYKILWNYREERAYQQRTTTYNHPLTSLETSHILSEWSNQIIFHCPKRVLENVFALHLKICFACVALFAYENLLMYMFTTIYLLF